MTKKEILLKSFSGAALYFFITNLIDLSITLFSWSKKSPFEMSQLKEVLLKLVSQNSFKVFILIIALLILVLSIAIKFRNKGFTINNYEFKIAGLLILLKEFLAFLYFALSLLLNLSIIEDMKTMFLADEYNSQIIRIISICLTIIIGLIVFNIFKKERVLSNIDISEELSKTIQKITVKYFAIYFVLVCGISLISEVFSLFQSWNQFSNMTDFLSFYTSRLPDNILTLLILIIGIILWQRNKNTGVSKLPQLSYFYSIFVSIQFIIPALRSAYSIFVSAIYDSSSLSFFLIPSVFSSFLNFAISIFIIVIAEKQYKRATALDLVEAEDQE